MATLSEMVSRIADYIERSDLGTQITKEINRAIEHYENEWLWFMESSSSFSTVTAQETYTSSDSIPTNISEIYRVEVSVNSSTKYELRVEPLNYVLDQNISSTVGQPVAYAYYSSNFYLTPIPDQTYTVKVYYAKTFDALASDNATNVWLTDGEDLIEQRAIWRVSSGVTGDIEKAAIAKGNMDDALRALRAKSEKLISSKKTKRYKF